MATKRAQGGVQGTAKAGAQATHIHASSLAVPNQANLARLEAQLTSLSLRIAPFLQRDVVLSRIDDSNPYRVELEGGDSSYAPLRRARLYSRLHVRFQDGGAELRVYSQGQGASKGSDLVNIKNLTCTQLDSGHGNGADAVSNGDAGGQYEGEGEVLPDEINAGGNYWRQITLAIGWIPHHTVIRSGHCFTIRRDEGLLVQVYLFHLLRLNEDTKPVTLERVSSTRVLQAVVTIALPSKPDGGSVDQSDRAHSEMVKLQESLRGLLDLSKDVD